jgi:hypothetical protein
MKVIDVRLDLDNFPSENVDGKAFKECFFRFKEELYSVSNDMRKNELALRIAAEYYKEGYTKRVIDLAEYMYYRTTENYQSATIQEKKVEPSKPTKPRPPNPFTKYRI